MKSGGGFQYEYKAISLLLNTNWENIDLYLMSDRRDVVEDYKRKDIDLMFMKYRQLDDTLIDMETFLSRKNIDIIYFLTPSSKPELLNNIPYIMTVWDLCHRDYNEFPEVRNNNEFENRENRYNILLKKAVKVIADSELGKKNICYRYGIDYNRVEVLKFLPRSIDETFYIDIKKKYKLKNDYIYYPAQFWAHKNHIYILKALKILKENYHICIDAIFSGTDYGNLEYIMEKSIEYNINNQVHYIGFVDDNEVPSLYRQSIALVMPTYFGPTNIPPLEAFYLNVPVCYSDLDGLRNQVGDAAFLMDLKTPQSLVDHLISITTDEKLVNYKKQQGLKILNSWKEEDFLDVIQSVLNDYSILRECWR